MTLAVAVQWGDDRLPPRFWNRVIPEPMSGCWLWVGGWTGSGYGVFADSTAHRVLYRVLKSDGVDMRDLDVDHLCRTRCCVNPDHLSLVTRAENLRRSNSVSTINARRTHCPKLHEYTEDNTYRNPRNGDRQCRICRAAHDLARQRRRQCRTGNP